MKKRIFISFSIIDEKLKGDYEVYKYNRDYKAESIWIEISNEIDRSDYYVIFLSQEALKSSAVQAEINMAYYKYVNNSKTNKFLIVPLLLSEACLMNIPLCLRALVH